MAEQYSQEFIDEMIHRLVSGVSYGPFNSIAELLVDIDKRFPNGPTPKVVTRTCGGYLATSLPCFRFQIGVIGDTRESAIKAFRASYNRWLKIADLECNDPIKKGRNRENIS